MSRHPQPQEIVRNCIAYAKKYPLEAHRCYQHALKICQEHNLNKLKASVLYESAKQDIDAATFAIQHDMWNFRTYFSRGMAYKSMGDMGLFPSNWPPKECYSRAIEDLLTGYKLSIPKEADAVWAAVVIAVDRDLQQHLKLSSFLTTEECTSVIYSMAINGEDWKCCHLEYLVAKSEQTGSGVAISLHCKLPEFDWKIIVTKNDFNPKIMEHLLSLSAILSHQALEAIVNAVDDNYTDILKFALNRFGQIPKSRIDFLCSLTIKKKKPRFCFCFVEHGAHLDIMQVLKEFKPSEIIEQKPLCDTIRSSHDGCMAFMQSCLKKGDESTLEYCKSVIQDVQKTGFNFNDLIQESVLSNKEASINFIEWILQEKFVDISETSDKSCPLYTLFKCPECDNKNKLYGLLLKYGANVPSISLSESDKQTILQTVAFSAFKSGDHALQEKCKEQILLVQHQISIDVFFSSFPKPEVKKFLQWLLEQHKVDLTKAEGKIYPLDAILELTCLNNKEKADLLYLLLSHGAQIMSCSTPKKRQTTFLHIVTNLAIDTNNTELMEVTCCQLFKEIEHLGDTEKMQYFVDVVNRETPYHIVMLRRQTDTTVKLCEILKEYPINPNLPNIRNIKAGRRRGSDSKKNSHQKRTSDKRYAILNEASKKFQNEAKKQIQKMSTKKTASYVPSRPVSEIKQLSPILEKAKKIDEVTSPQLTKSQILVLIREELKRIKDQLPSYFTPPPDYNRQSSAKLKNQPPSRQVSIDETVVAYKSQKLKEATFEDHDKESCITLEEDCDFFENCAWEVEFTDNVKKFLSHTKTPKVWKKEVFNKVKQIATDCLPHSHRLCGVLGKDIYETRFSKGGRILWEIAIQFSSRLTAHHSTEVAEKQYVYTEVIRLWAIVPDHGNVERELKNIERSIARGQTAAKPLPLLKMKENTTSDKKRYPQCYSYHDSDHAYKRKEELKTSQYFPAGSMKEDEYNVVTFYSLNNLVVQSMLNGEDARRDFPFKEWPKEHDIINIPDGKQSILLLGRSGTGKTTCCLYRMWNQFHVYWLQRQTIYHQLLPILKSEEKMDMDRVLASYDSNVQTSNEYKTCNECTVEEEEEVVVVEEEEVVVEEEKETDSQEEHLHQIFITKNYVLCSQMKKKFYDLVAGSTIARQHKDFENQEVPLNLSDVDDLAFPLFLTARQFFIILDNSLGDGKTFFERDDMGNMKEKILSSDYDHEDPETLLDLEESDSEGEYDEEVDEDTFFDKPHTNSIKQRERHEVTAAYFTKNIWPNLCRSAAVKNKLDPLLVWMEIKSFIKGSQNAVETDRGFVCQQEYQTLGKKMAPNYAAQREEVYKMFQDYVKYMQIHRQDNLFDECDLIHNIYSRLNHLDDLPWSIHSIYVDEVQDFTQAELSILLRICRNPNDLFFTGDTAQSIMRGISFRFSDLRYLYHCAKERLSKRKIKGPKIVVPKVRDLQINFRSHTGVLNLAASVIDIMMKYFPSSFDRLPGDEGMFTGPMPIVLESSNISDLALVLHTNKRESSKKIEFGAHQVIIVQSEEAKENIPDVLKSSIILTVFESKGLEFDDVLLYDFFKDSQVKEEWRVVTSFINAEDNRGLIVNAKSPFGKTRPLTFDNSLHKSLNSELKYLYTAITRARCNLWIYDSHEIKRRPVFEYWHKRGLIKVVKIDDETEQSESTLFASTSTSEEWKDQGDYFKKKGLWEPAMKCYQKAQCLYLEYEAHGYSLVQQARKLVTKNPQELYLQAAKRFLDCTKLDHSHHYRCLDNAAKCLMYAKHYDDAASLFVLLGMHDRALKCCRKTKNYTVLAEIKEKKGEYNDAVRLFLKGNSFIKALECASKYENYISPVYKKERLAHKYAQSQLKTIILTDTLAVDEFLSTLKYLPPSEQVDYLKSVKLYDKAVEILQKEQKNAEVYQICKAQGWFEKGLELAEQEKDADAKMMFLIFKATKELESNCLSEYTLSMLRKNYGYHTEKENRCMLMYGIATHNHTFFHRPRAYYKRNNQIAYLEVLYIATENVQYDADDHKWKNIQLDKNEELAKTILSACTSISIIKEELEHAKKTNSPFITYLETFFGFEKDHSGMYLISKSSYPWTNQLLKQHIAKENLEQNPDGLIKIDVDSVLKAICCRFEEFCKYWIAEDRIGIVQILCKQINWFSYHQQVMSCGGHLQESSLNKRDKRLHLQAYLNILSSLFEMQQFGNKTIGFDIIRTVINALSPQATAYLQISDGNAPKASHRPALQLMLSPKLNAELYKRVKDKLYTDDQTFNTDEWLEMWRILSITGHKYEMQKILFTKSVEFNNEIKMKKHHSQSVPQFVLHPKTGVYNHLIQVWLDVCEKMKSKRIYPACTVCVKSFILPIASNHILWEKISVSNFLNVVSVQLVAILMMISICSIHSRNPGNIYIPHSYLNVVEVYLGMIGGADLFNSCYEDTLRSRKEKLQELKMKLIHLLRLILKGLLGKHNLAFNLLQKSLSDESCLRNHEAEHCLVFVLTLLGNLGLDKSVSDTELQSFRQQISKSMKACEKPIVQQAYETFSISSTLNNYFGVIKIILQASRDTLQHLDVHFTSTFKCVCDNKPAQLMDIDQRRLLSLTDDKELKALAIREFKLQPTATAFVPSWMKPKESKSENKPPQPVAHSDDVELDDVDIALQNPEKISDTMQDSLTEKDYSVITNGMCHICACTLNPDIQNDDISSTERAKIVEHCHSEDHQKKCKEHENYISELELHNTNNKLLFDLADRCHKQYELSRQDQEMKKIMEAISKLSKEFDAEKEQITNTANWREGIAIIESIGEKIQSLIKTGERELEMAQERKQKLDQEQEEEDRKEQEELDEVDDDWDEPISHTDPNCGELSKKKNRSAKKRKSKKKK